MKRIAHCLPVRGIRAKLRDVAGLPVSSHFPGEHVQLGVATDQILRTIPNIAKNGWKRDVSELRKIKEDAAVILPNTDNRGLPRTSVLRLSL